MADERRQTDRQCPPCEAFLGEEKPEACTFFQDYLSDEEQEVLGMLRELKNQARTLRGKIRGIEHAITMSSEMDEGGPSQGTPERARAQQELYRELGECREQLDEIRDIWKEWEAKREEAHHRKMMLLGHRPWDSP